LVDLDLDVQLGVAVDYGMFKLRIFRAYRTISDNINILDVTVIMRI